MQRLYQLRHYLDCKLFVVIEETHAYTNKFTKLKESDPYHMISERFTLVKHADISKLCNKALELDTLKSRILDWELPPDIMLQVEGATEEEEKVEGEVPEWVSFGKGNWSRQFTVKKKVSRDLFIALVEKIKESKLNIEVRIQKWHISLYNSSGKLAAVVYARKEYLVFLMKNVEDQYSQTTLETVEKPATDYIIQSATRYLLLRSKDKIGELVKLLSIAAN